MFDLLVYLRTLYQVAVLNKLLTQISMSFIETGLTVWRIVCSTDHFGITPITKLKSSSL